MTVIAWLDEDGLSEIRVIRALGEKPAENELAFLGFGGERWLQDQHLVWTSEGFRMIAAGLRSDQPTGPLLPERDPHLPAA